MAVMHTIKSTQSRGLVPLRTLRKFITGACVTALLLLMFAPGMWIPTLHGEHDHGHESCQTGLSETDPCHRKIVHSDILRGCAHAQHLSGEASYCAGCRLLFVGYLQFFHFFRPADLTGIGAPILVFIGLAHLLPVTLQARGRSPPR